MMPAESSYFATYNEGDGAPTSTSASTTRSRPDVPHSPVTRTPSLSATSHAGSSGSSIETTSSALHASQSVQRVALHARRASASSQVLLRTGSRLGFATPLQAALLVRTVSSRSSVVGGDDSGELNANLLEAIDWPRPPASALSISSSVRSLTPLTLSRPAASPIPPYSFLQSDPAAPSPSPSGSRTLTLPPPPHFYQSSPVDGELPRLDHRWGFASPGASTTRFSGFTNKTSLSVDVWSEIAAKGSTSTLAIMDDGLQRSISNDSMTTGRAVKGRDSLSSLASKVARTLSDRSRKSSKRGSGSSSVKSAAGIAWEPCTYGSDEAAKMRSWEEVGSREDRLGLSALLGRAMVMEKILKDGKRLPFGGPTGYVHYPALAATGGRFAPPRRPSSLQSVWKMSSTPPSSSRSAVRSSSGKSHKTPSIKSATSKRLSVKTDRDRGDAYTPLDDGDEPAPLALVVHRGESPPPLPEKRRSAYACCADIPEEKSPAYVEDKVFDLTPDGPHLHTRKVRMDSVDWTPRQRDSRMSQMSRWARDGKRWRLAVAAGVAVVVILITGLLVGLLTRRQHSDHDPRPTVRPAAGCGNGKVGISCSIDSECTSSYGGSAVSRALVDLLPSLSATFGLAVTTEELASVLASAGLPPLGTDCGQQAVLVDVGSTLVTAESRSLVAWAQTAILWQLVRSEDTTTAMQLRDAINSASWAQTGIRLASAAVVITLESRATRDRTLEFQGWHFDFDRLSVTPKNASWVVEAQPSPFQKSLADASMGTLNKMASYAKASSAQRSMALSRYWIGPLKQPLDSLNPFLAAVNASPFNLPFNASSSTDGIDLVSQLTNATKSFPPSTVCLPSLDSTKRAELRDHERSAFSLNGADCSERPVYGSINLFRRHTVNASQSLVLNEDTKARALLRCSASNASDPMEWGSPGAIEHVVLSWLRAMPSVDIALEAVHFISRSTSPIAPSSSPSLTSPDLPQIELALLGPSLISTTNFTMSLLSDPEAGLFFGSAQASRLRSWALQSTNGGPPMSAISPAIVWALNATSTEVFVEQSVSDAAFDAVFEHAAALIQATKVAGRRPGENEEAAVVAELRKGGLGSRV